MVFFGNLAIQSVSIPDDKLKEIVWVINHLLKSPFISGAALESLTGKIFHWSQLNKLTKPLAFQCVQFIYNHIRKK